MSREDAKKWNARYVQGAGEPEPHPVLLAHEHLIPVRGNALDVAGGAGRHALWLAARGCQVTLADVSVAGLKRAGEAAVRKQLQLRTLQADLEEVPLPTGPWDLILCVSYLQRSLFPQFEEALAPGGRLVVIHPTKLNLERHAKPPARFLLDPGELPGLAGKLKVLVSREQWWECNQRHQAILIASRENGHEAPSAAAECSNS